jgi:UDP-glucose 4-epimerase
MKIAIVGGAGFIGSHLAKAYLDAGHDVLIIDTLINGSLEAVDARARFYQVDMRDRKLLSILQRERPDIVSHHAVHRSQDSQPLEELSLVDADVHVRGLLNVLDSCVAALVSKIIFASSGDSLYGDGGSVAAEEQGHGKTFIAREDTPLSPLKPCDISKVAGEGYVRYYTRKYGLSHTIFRYADVYGETDKELAQHPLTYFTRMLLERRRPVIRGAADEKRDHIFIDDVVQANFRALARGHNQTLHISTGQGHSLNDLFAAAASSIGSELEPLYLSQSLLHASSCILDNSQAALALGWTPAVDFSSGVRWAVERFSTPVEAQCIAPLPQSTYINEHYLVGAR